MIASSLATNLGLRRQEVGLRSFLLAGAVSTLAGAAWAADAPAAQVDEIVVTSLKRASVLQDTPLPITATTGETLQKAGVVSLTDYVKLAPSLKLVDGGPGSKRVVIRGVQAAGEATVQVYYDETPIDGSTGVSSDAGGRSPDISLFDVERVEVLRGPQGTLYGASSMTGAIRVIFKKPTFDYQGEVTAGLSAIERGGAGYSATGMVNIPIVQDKLAARAVLYTGQGGGYVDDPLINRQNINSSQNSGGHLLLRFRPIDSLTIDASAFLDKTDSWSSSWNPAAGNYVSLAKVALPYNDDTRVYNVTANWDLGPVAVTASSSYFDRKFVQAADDTYYIQSQKTAANCKSVYNNGVACDATALAGFYAYVDGLGSAAIYYPSKTTDWTNEVRLTSTGDTRLKWTLGVFTQDRDNDVESEDVLADPVTGAIREPHQVPYHRYIKDNLKQTAGFGEASYDIFSKLTLTFGARYYSYDKTVTGATDIAWPLIGAALKPETTVKSSESGWIYKFNAAYKLTPDVMFYAEAAQGFRPGGVNQVIGLPDALTPYQSDSLWNYELGTKTSWFSHRLLANLTAFQIDWDNMQVSGRTLNNAFSFISNAGAARIRGAEFELTATPMAGLDINANASYIDAQLTQDQVNASVAAAGRAGDPIPYIPKFTGAISVQYRHPVVDSIDFLIRGDLNYVGSSYSEFRPSNVYRVKNPDYTLANLRAGFENAGDWGLYIYVNNLFNEVAINRWSNSSTGPVGGTATSAAPRTAGITLNKKF